MNPDFRDLLHAFSVADVRFVVVGAYAVAAHGAPRATGDIDVFIEASEENARRVMKALRHFGAALHDLTEEDLARVGTVFQMGVPPRRIDVLTHISGLEFAEVWDRRMAARFADVDCYMIGLEDLLHNKRATGREKDARDATALERILAGGSGEPD